MARKKIDFELPERAGMVMEINTAGAFSFSTVEFDVPTDQSLIEIQVPSVGKTCSAGRDCENTEYCKDCAYASCPQCSDCVSACALHQRYSNANESLKCNRSRPDCGTGETAIVVDGCWECICTL